MAREIFVLRVDRRPTELIRLKVAGHQTAQTYYSHKPISLMTQTEETRP